MSNAAARISPNVRGRIPPRPGGVPAGGGGGGGVGPPGRPLIRTSVHSTRFVLAKTSPSRLPLRSSGDACHHDVSLIDFMMPMGKRTTLTLEDDVAERIDAEARRTGRS